MNKNDFNVQMNALINQVERLEHRSVLELTEEITTVALNIDAFKEKCLKELFK